MIALTKDLVKQKVTDQKKKKSATNKTAMTSVLNSVGRDNVAHTFLNLGGEMANLFFFCFSSICYRSVKVQRKSKHPPFLSIGHGFL